jgi:hypothetical protein
LFSSSVAVLATHIGAASPPEAPTALSGPPGVEGAKTVVSTAAGVRAGRPSPTGGVSRSSKRSRLDLAIVGAVVFVADLLEVAAVTVVAALNADAGLAGGSFFFDDTTATSSSSELDELSELLSLSSYVD